MAALAGLVILTCLGFGLGAAATTSASCWGGGGSEAREVGAFFREGLTTGAGVVEAVGAMVARLLGTFGVAAATAAAAFLLPGDRRARVLTMLGACVWLFVAIVCSQQRLMMMKERSEENVSYFVPGCKKVVRIARVVWAYVVGMRKAW